MLPSVFWSVQSLIFRHFFVLFLVVSLLRSFLMWPFHPTIVHLESTGATVVSVIKYRIQSFRTYAAYSSLPTPPLSILPETPFIS